MTASTSKAILVVDDCEDDVKIFERAPKIVGLTVPIHCVDSVEDAICYLKGEGRFSDRVKYPMARLILLDLTLHGRSGLDVLKWVRSRPELCKAIIVAMTSSENPTMPQKAYQLGANAFLIKPFGSDATNEMVKGLHHYWFTLNRT